MLESASVTQEAAHKLATTALEKATSAEEIADECRVMFYELKKTMKTVVDAVLEHHAERLKLSVDIARFRKMNILLASLCGLTFGLFGGMVLVLFVKALGH